MCTVLDTTITLGTATQISSNQGSGYYSCAKKIETDKVFIVHNSDDTNDYLSAIICTISGATITAGTDTQLSLTSNSSYHSSAVLIDTNKIFIVHGVDNTNYYLYGMVCTISGTTITAGTDTQLSNISKSGYHPCVTLIDTNKVFVSYGNAYDNGNLFGIICTISGTTITNGTYTQLTTINKASPLDHKSVLIDTNKILLLYVYDSGTSSALLKSIICTISGTTITVGNEYQLFIEPGTLSATPTIMATLISTNKIFIAFGNDDYKLYAMVATEGNRIIEATTKIDGLTKTLCTTDTTGAVWILDNQE